MFNLYFAGSDNPAWREYLIAKNANRLASWINDRNVIDAWIENKAKGHLFIDSGAFSAHTLGKEVDIDKYIEFLNSIDDYVYIAAALDKIPGVFRQVKTRKQCLEAPLIGWENYLYMRERVKSPDKILPVFHQNEDFDWLITMLETTFDGKHIPYIGVSPANDRSTKEKNEWFEVVFRMIGQSSNPNVKTHAFGMTSLPVLERYPFTSADSTSWLMTGANGGIMTPNGTVIISEKQKDNPQHISHQTTSEIQEVKALCKKFKFKFDELATSYQQRCNFNIAYLLDWCKNYTFKGTEIKKRTLIKLKPKTIEQHKELIRKAEIMELQKEEDLKLMHIKAQDNKIDLKDVMDSATTDDFESEIETVEENTAGRHWEEFGTVKNLGAKTTKYIYDYDPEQLEYFENKHPDNDYVVKFNAYEFTSLCLHGDTLIDVACDETKHPQGIPIKELVGKTGYVFGVNPENGSAVCKKFFDVRKTGDSVPMVEVKYSLLKGPSNNRRIEYKSIKCTPNHMFLVKQGFDKFIWKEAKDLKENDKLVADQRTKDTIRQKIRHQLVAESMFGFVPELVHHIDHNHYNNQPENLEISEMSSHNRHHRHFEYGYEGNLDVEKLVEQYNSGHNLSSLAKLYSCDTSTIRNRLQGKVSFRSQSESLKLRNLQVTVYYDEVVELYSKGYTTYEIADYFGKHSSTIGNILKAKGVKMRESNYSNKLKKQLELPALNHNVVSVEPCGNYDSYNMEVEDVHCFFANDVIVHNCPKTGQPDFATIHIKYIPAQKMVESKSLKLYLFSFRNHGDFHEDCVNIIMKDLVKLLQPKYLEVKGLFTPRGGIAIHPFATYSNGEEKYNEIERQRQLEELKGGF